MELVPNIILNPGFCDSDDQEIFSSPFIKRYNIKYEPARQKDEDELDSDLSEQSEIIPFKRRLSIFFTEGTIKRMWMELWSSFGCWWEGHGHVPRMVSAAQRD